MEKCSPINYEMDMVTLKGTASLVINCKNDTCHQMSAVWDKSNLTLIIRHCCNAYAKEYKTHLLITSTQIFVRLDSPLPPY